MPGLLKIGMTTRDPFARADEISAATGVPVPFVVSAYFLCGNPKELESLIHERLAEHRVGGEFFEILLSDALQQIGKAFCGEISEIQIRQGESYGVFSTVGVRALSESELRERQLEESLRKLRERQFREPLEDPVESVRVIPFDSESVAPKALNDRLDEIRKVRKRNFDAQNRGGQATPTLTQRNHRPHQ